MAVANSISLKTKWMVYLILTGSILTFSAWTVMKHCDRETNFTYMQNRMDRFETAVIKFQQKRSSNSETHNIKTQGHTDILEQVKELSKNTESLLPRALNVYNTSKSVPENKNLCFKTNAPKRFIICAYSDAEDMVVSGFIRRYGLWEKSITRRIYRALNQEKTITFIDIGANIGYFSLLAAAAGQTVISVEPWKRHVHKLASSINLNKFQNNITVINNAVSYERRDVKINTTRHGNMGGARLVSDDEHADIKESILVKSIIMNDLAALIHTPFVVIKLDIEGHECRALERSEDVFDNFKVLLITMEWGLMQRFRHNPGSACQEENIKEMVEMLTKRGFIPFSDRRNIPLDPNYHKNWTDFDIYWKPISEKNLYSNI